MRVFTAAEMKEAEAAAVEAGTSYRQLMENAGAASASFIQDMANRESAERTIVFVCGKGNNAGDAFVAARILAEDGWQVRLLMLYLPTKREPRRASTTWPSPPGGSLLLLCNNSPSEAGKHRVDTPPLAAESAPAVCGAGACPGVNTLYSEGYSELASLNVSLLPQAVERIPADKITPASFSAAFVVDGVFGTGFRGELPPLATEVFAGANSSSGLRVALDVPSGLNCDTGHAAKDTFRAHHTITFGAYKPALVMRHTFPYTGTVHCVDIGL